MPENRLRFIHVSGLLIDHQLEQVGELPDDARRSVEEATFFALDRLVKRALQDDVDFIVLAGNAFDESDLSLRLPIALREACEQLDEQEIRLFVLPGDCDPPSAWLALGALPENVTLFAEAGGESIAVFRDNRVIATVGYGESADEVAKSAARAASRLDEESLPHSKSNAFGKAESLPDRAEKSHPAATLPGKSTSPNLPSSTAHAPPTAGVDSNPAPVSADGPTAAAQGAGQGAVTEAGPAPAGVAGVGGGVNLPKTSSTNLVPGTHSTNASPAPFVPTTNVIPKPAVTPGPSPSPAVPSSSPSSTAAATSATSTALSKTADVPAAAAATTSSETSSPGTSSLDTSAGEQSGKIVATGGNIRETTGSKPAASGKPHRRHPFAVRVQWLYPGMRFPTRLPEWVDYLALGGAHPRRTAEVGEGRIHHPGELFATPPTAASGTASLVTVDPSGTVSFQEIGLSPVMFRDQQLEMTAETSRQELLQRLARAMATPAPSDVEQVRIVRWQIRGSGALFDSLRQQDFQRGFLDAVRKASGLRESIHVSQRIEILSDGHCWEQAAASSRWAGEYLASLDEQPPLSLEVFREQLTTSGLAEQSPNGLLVELCQELADSTIHDRARRLGVQWFAGVPESGTGEPG